MSWATPWIEKLQRGETVQFRPRGNSMRGKVNDGDLVTVEPVKDPAIVKQGDVVLCKVAGKHFLHLVVDDHDGTHDRFLIGNMKGFTNGWTAARNIYGRVVRVEP